jgi:4-amino-4-deoxy-L-arabinose transferase-like glycosyltransferase
MPLALRIRVTTALDRLMDALSDPKRRERTVVIVLAVYCALWTLYGVIAKGSQDIHFDMGEMIAWSRETVWGTPKHPPFGAWLVRIWFSIFPLTDWAYYLFAMVIATSALWIAWAISGRYLQGEKRVAGLALLTLVPFFNFHALKFNANTVMMPLWAATTALFLRSYETRSLGWAALAGLAAAAAVLGKYWSIVLLMGLGIAVLADPRRGAYFRSWAPWVTIATGAAGLLPHLGWLYANNFRPFTYAMESHPGTLWETITSGLAYVTGAAGYAAFPIALAALAAQPTLAALRDTVWPGTADRRLVLLAFVLPLMLPLLVAVVAHELIISIWSIGSMTLLPVVLLSSPQISLPIIAVRRIVALAVLVPLVALAVSPLIALTIHRRGVPNYATHYRLLAQRIEDVWAQTTDRPLRIVGSYNNLLYGVLSYLPSRPSTLEIVSPYLTPWTTEAQVARDGIALVCPVEENPCMQALARYAARGPAGKRVEVEISRSYLGANDPPDRFVILTLPPRQSN